MSPELIRQELVAWIKAQREALPEQREEWAHGSAETLRDLMRELDRIFGPQNSLTHAATSGVNGERAAAAPDADDASAEPKGTCPAPLVDRSRGIWS